MLTPAGCLWITARSLSTCTASSGCMDSSNLASSSAVTACRLVRDRRRMALLSARTSSSVVAVSSTNTFASNTGTSSIGEALSATDFFYACPGCVRSAQIGSNLAQHAFCRLADVVCRAVNAVYLRSRLFSQRPARLFALQPRPTEETIGVGAQLTLRHPALLAFLLG